MAKTRERLKRPGAWPTDVVRRGQTASFDQRRAKELLGYESRVLVARGIEAFAEWVRAEGGAEALATRVRAPATDDDVADQIQRAG